MTSGRNVARIFRLASAASRPHPVALSIVHYGLALLTTALAILLTFILAPFVERTLFLFFFIAVAVSAWWGGLGPGLLTTLFAVATANYFFISPLDRWIKGPGDLVALSAFGVVAVIVSSLSESRRAARRVAEREATEARHLADRLREQATELQRRTGEATALAVELTQSNQHLQASVSEAVAARQVAETAVARLSESEARFRTMADTAPVLIWLSGVRGERTYFNRSWLEFTGRTLEQEIGQGWVEDIHPEDVHLYRRDYNSSISARDPFRMEYRLRHVDGEYRWVLDIGVPRITSEGGFVGFIGSCVDITERKEIEHSQHFLLEAARLLASSLDIDTTLRQVIALLVPRFADYCLVYLRAEDNSLSKVAAAHVDPAKTKLVEELSRVSPLEPDHPDSVLARAWQGGKPVFMPDGLDPAGSTVRDPKALEICLDLAPRSHAFVPLIARGATLGVISLATSVSGRQYNSADVDLLELLELFGARAALALDNARLYAEVRQAHERDLRTSQLESQLIQAHLEALRAQLNPHFLFNALNTIAMLVRREANPQALQGIVGLSQLLRQVLDRRKTPEVRLGEELGLIEHYLTVEQLRFRDRLRVRVSVAPEVLDALVPSLILQPLVENAVRHGVGRSGGRGGIEIEGRRRKGALKLEVRDDGPGFPEGWNPVESAGIGLSNTRERLQRMYGRRHRFKVGNARSGGAVVSITIPFCTSSKT
jgi:PAS domain S-box-containing protein